MGIRDGDKMKIEDIELNEGKIVEEVIMEKEVKKIMDDEREKGERINLGRKMMRKKISIMGENMGEKEKEEVKKKKE